MNPRLTNFIPWASLIAACIFLIYKISLGVIPLDVGDGLEHYAIAKQAWIEKKLFLDHWGKPLFTLFSSPFAQFGYKSYTIFNVFVFFGTVAFGYSILKKNQIISLWSALIPWLLLIVPDYSNSLVAGLTEPFFGFLLVILLWTALNEKWTFFAIIASLMPFARSEGMLVLILAFALLVLFKQWKKIPYLSIGFILAIVFGHFLIHNAAWYFNQDPYPAESPYGHGVWNHYLSTYKIHFGTLNLILIPFSIFGFFVWRQDNAKPKTWITLFFVSLYLGIIIIHSYFWAYGLKGSAGLTRIALQGLPPFLILQYLFIGKILSAFHRVGIAVLLTLMATFIVAPRVLSLKLIHQADRFETILQESVSYVNTHKKLQKVYYFHPLIGFFNGKTTRDKDLHYVFRFIHLDDDLKSRFKPFDLIIRDSKFGPVEQGLPLELIKGKNTLVPIKHFYTGESYLESNGESRNVTIYQIIPESLQQSSKLQTKTIQKKFQYKPQRIHFKNGEEYFNINTQFKVPPLHGSCQELVIKTNYTGEKPLILYFVSTDGLMLSSSITSDSDSTSLLFNKGNIIGNLYIHNATKDVTELMLKLDYWNITVDPGIQLPAK